MRVGAEAPKSIRSTIPASTRPPKVVAVPHPMGVWSFVVARRRPSPTALHPVPG